MRFWTAAVAILVISLATVGCKFPKITISVSITPQGKANVNNEKTVSEVSPSDVDSTSQQAMNTLIDTEPVLTYDSSSPT